MVPVLGARRRIQSLFAIGYDMGTLGRKAPGIHEALIEAMNPATTEITEKRHHAIDGFWHRTRFSHVPGFDVHSSPYPTPGQWHNIDDPKETH
jgi:hypothetical protein